MKSKAIVFLALTLAVAAAIACFANCKATQIPRLPTFRQYSKNELSELIGESPDPFVTEQLYEQYLRICKNEKDTSGESSGLESYSLFCHQNGKKAKAIDLMRRSIYAAEKTAKLDYRWSPSYSLVQLYELDGRLDLAWQACLEEHQRGLSKKSFDQACKLPMMFLMKHKWHEKACQFNLNLLDKFKLAADQDRTYQELAELSIEQNNYSEAKAWLQKISKDYECFHLVQNQLAWCNLKTGNTQAAERYYKRELRKAMPFCKMPIFGGIEADRLEWEYGVRHDYMMFMKETGRAKAVEAHAKFCATMDDGYPQSYVANLYSYPRMPCRFDRSLEIIAWDKRFKSAYKHPRSTNIADGVLFLYGKFSDKEFDLKRQVVAAEDALSKFWSYQELFQYYADSNRLDKMTETMEEWLSYTQKSDKAIPFEKWAQIHPGADGTPNMWREYRESFALDLGQQYFSIARPNRTLVAALLKKGQNKKALHLVSERLKLFPRDQNGKLEFDFFNEYLISDAILADMQLFYKYKYYEDAAVLSRWYIDERKCIKEEDQSNHKNCS